MNIKAFKIHESEEFVLGEQLDIVKDKLEKAGYGTNIEENKGLKILSNEYNNMLLVFDKDNRLVGFVNNYVDGSDQEEIGIKIISKDDVEHEFTIGEFANELTDDVVDLEKHYINANDPDMYPMQGYLNYSKLTINNTEYITQCTEMQDCIEIVSLLRKDIANTLPIILGGGLGLKEYKDVNITELIK